MPSSLRPVGGLVVIVANIDTPDFVYFAILRQLRELVFLPYVVLDVLRRFVRRLPRTLVDSDTTTHTVVMQDHKVGLIGADTCKSLGELSDKDFSPVQIFRIYQTKPVKFSLCYVTKSGVLNDLGHISVVQRVLERDAFAAQLILSETPCVSSQGAEAIEDT